MNSFVTSHLGQQATSAMQLRPAQRQFRFPTFNNITILKRHFHFYTDIFASIMTFVRSIIAMQGYNYAQLL